MHYQPLATELDQLETMSAAERLLYATTRMLECEEVWSLGNDNGWKITDVDDKEVICIWPYRILAEQYGREGAASASPQATSLEQFVYGVLDMCQQAEIVLEVFPTENEAGVLMDADSLYQLLSGMMETGEYTLEG